MANYQFRIQHFKSIQILANIASFELFGVLNPDTDFLALDIFCYLLKPHLLQIKNDVGNIFLDA